MAKTKRKHLAALDVQKRQRLPALEAPMRLPSSRKQESPLNSVHLELSSSTSLSPLDEARSSPDAYRDATAEISCNSLSPRHQAQANTKPSCLPQHDDSDSDSWVDVRKQRVVIVIPPLPQAKSKSLSMKLAQSRKGKAQCTPRKNRAVLPEDRACEKGRNSKVSGKKTRKNATRGLETDNKGIGRRSRGNISRDAPPISSMDILLASALGTDHMPWQDKQRHHIDLLASCTQEEASLDTADSSIQPKGSSIKRIKPVLRNKGASKLPVISNKAKKLMRPQQPTTLINDLRKPGDVNMKMSQSTNDTPILCPSEAIRILTLKRHLEKAGGVKRWLCSLGLGQFKEAFEKRMWNEWDLLQLQMDDLKQMGKLAVGPRRKLIWAIHHLSRQMV